MAMLVILIYYDNLMSHNKCPNGSQITLCLWFIIQDLPLGKKLLDYVISCFFLFVLF